MAALSFLAAHGFDPGPSQRPFSSGAISGILATIPAIAVLFAFGSLKVEAHILGWSILATLCAGWAAMAVCGALYARIFGRAANDVRGGWLFGAAFGFALWAAGAVLVLPIVTGGRAPAGSAALGVAISMLVWGVAIGILLPFVHRPLHESLERGSKRAEVGPSAAAGQKQPIKQQRGEKRT
jgi:Na+/melibiose symporter-like transporter